MLGVAALFPYVIVAGVISVVLLALRRRWVLTVVAVVVMAGAIATQVPLFVGNTPPADGVAMRLMTVNVRLGTAIPALLFTQAAARADVLALQELTGKELNDLAAAGLNNVFPYSSVNPLPGAAGVGLWSRYPITESGLITDYRMPFIRAKIRVPGVATSPTVVVGHLRNPWFIADWRHDIGLLPTTLRELAGDGGAAIVAGDFNSTLDMRPFRDLLTDGYHDAVEQAGAGFVSTFPAGDVWLPPLITIDHVLTLRATAVTASALRVYGSDHLGLVTTLKIPPR